MADWNLIVRYPFLHPHYEEYKKRCLDAALSTSFIEKSWCCIIQGMQRRAELIQSKSPNVPIPELIALGELVRANASVLMTPPGLNQDTVLALWSGGIAVSKFVREVKKYETLESTLYGDILDRMTSPESKIWLGGKGWGPQGALWNIISAEYVNVVAKIRNTMHVFMRTHDLDSVFYREELVNWQKAKGKGPTEPDGLTYHILVGMDSLKIEHVFDCEKDAKEYLLTVLAQVNQQFNINMLESGANFRYRSEVWRDNQRAFEDTIRKKSFDSYEQFMKAPLASTIEEYSRAEQLISPNQSFDPQHFAKVMDELVSRVAPIE